MLAGEMDARRRPSAGRGTAMRVSEREYKRLALDDRQGHWEMHCGQPRRKPDMTAEHNQLMTELGFALRGQLDPSAYVIRINTGRARRLETTYYISDVMVIPAPLLHALLRRPGTLEAYTEPLPLVVEVWSPSTGEYDVDQKLPEYQRRGDAEIWRLHPYDRTLTSWQHQPDGSYLRKLHTGGTVEPVALPGVRIDLDTLFALGTARA
jgi:Uma2 family endonuclease